MMIKIIRQTDEDIALLQCTNCHSDNDVKIISLQYDGFSKNMIPLCRDCRKYLLELLLCDAESKADTGNSNSNNEEE